jgi:hypothetical protein
MMVIDRVARTFRMFNTSLDRLLAWGADEPRNDLVALVAAELAGP